LKRIQEDSDDSDEAPDVKKFCFESGSKPTNILTAGSSVNLPVPKIKEETSIGMLNVSKKALVKVKPKPSIIGVLAAKDIAASIKLPTGPGSSILGTNNVSSTTASSSSQKAVLVKKPIDSGSSSLGTNKVSSTTASASSQRAVLVKQPIDSGSSSSGTNTVSSSTEASSQSQMAVLVRKPTDSGNSVSGANQLANMSPCESTIPIYSNAPDGRLMVKHMNIPTLLSLIRSNYASESSGSASDSDSD